MRLNGFMQISPCKDCKKHSETCHGKCEKYKKYKDDLNEIKTTVFYNKMDSKLYDCYKKKIIRNEYGKGGKK